MKLINQYNLYILLLACGLMAGCSKITEDNIDPNNPSVDKATPQLLLPSAFMCTAGQIGGEYAITGGLWSQYYTQSAFASQYRTIDAYNMVSSDNNIAYREVFRNALIDYKKVQDLSEEASNWPFYMMATVMKAYTYHVVVDLYDQVPYSEALGGSTNLQPKFDDGYSIYTGLLGEINNAMSKNYKVGVSASDAVSDIIFGGDMAQWERFANTLKLKLYLRMVNAKASEAQTGITALYTANAPFLEDGAGITIFEDRPNYSNPFYEQNIRRLNTNDNLRASYTFVSWLRKNNDPRVVSYFGSANPGTIHQGDYTSNNPAYASAAVFVQHATDPVWFISKAESYLMQAEARARYFAGAGAKALYDEGVTAAFAQLNLTPGTLLTGAYAFPDGGTLEQKIEAISTQKWASFPGTHDLEGFFEQNRTGYPKNSPVYSTAPTYVAGQFAYSANGVTGGLFPKRLLFPEIERSRNINTPGEEPITKKVWWAK
ncbi:SusD/RagB family nutrient-binding outer membrane lipoprotein [Paraflavitalea sp. CAU 1676]|uniref:SusD/RagB family nutrient-binding outer membrane lipoprotein n=1 Tax=Paraflavitalea sp. CAU 1676 TaxID=3032598 RepID=UPI0023DC7194|nr:SusD/RagB family nutrient-binding outer membrane lipoprotein [Paraflavitalea sp. CAU 1676]MDF2188210.1 SusD/RagB family nutrient-binding outer membrane lipoprotein [Paraflavitalea sp. CAU 1676]